MYVRHTAVDEMVGRLDASTLRRSLAIIDKLASLLVLRVVSLIVLLGNGLGGLLPLYHDHTPRVGLHLLKLAVDSHVYELLVLLVLIVVCIDTGMCRCLVNR